MLPALYGRKICPAEVAAQPKVGKNPKNSACSVEARAGSGRAACV